MADTSLITLSPFDTFTHAELNEPLIMLYRMMRVVFAAGSDTLTVTPAMMIWSKDGRMVNDFHFHPSATPPFYDQLAAMIDRDAIIRAHVDLVATDGTTRTYRVHAH